jgi:hypothetical protein
LGPKRVVTITSGDSKRVDAITEVKLNFPPEGVGVEYLLFEFTAEILFDQSEPCIGVT